MLRGGCYARVTRDCGCGRNRLRVSSMPGVGELWDERKCEKRAC